MSEGEYYRWSQDNWDSLVFRGQAEQAEREAEAERLGPRRLDLLGEISRADSDLRLLTDPGDDPKLTIGGALGVGYELTTGYAFVAGLVIGVISLGQAWDPWWKLPLLWIVGLPLAAGIPAAVLFYISGLVQHPKWVNKTERSRAERSAAEQRKANAQAELDRIGNAMDAFDRQHDAGVIDDATYQQQRDQLLGS